MSEFVEQLVSIPEMAKALGVTEATIRGWIQRGTVASHKLGKQGSNAGRRLIPLSEVNRIINESRVPARAEAQ